MFKITFIVPSMFMCIPKLLTIYEEFETLLLKIIKLHEINVKLCNKLELHSTLVSGLKIVYNK